jgi:peptidoglycan/xylan/chitin deacetylase (PgdA/CDA1 family)
MNPRQALKSGLLALLSLPAAMNRAWALPILTYHAVTDTPSRIAVPPALFRRQVAHLRQAGYRSITFAEAARVLDAGPQDALRLVCFTFDDAYRSVLENAVPVLQEAGFVATIFLPTAHEGRANRWDTAAPPRGWPILSWGELNALARDGFEIGSHTRTHPHLPELDDASLKEEVAGSRRELEDRLGLEVPSFCYPFGHHDARTRAAVRAAGYRTACTTEFGACIAEHDPMRLPRIGTAPLRTPFQFRAALGGAFELYLRARGRAAPRPAATSNLRRDRAPA